MWRLFVAALAAFGLQVQARSAMHLDDAWVLVNEQFDPVVSPNAQSSHMHKVIGSSRFGASYNYDNYNGAKCSSLAVQADKSNYWMPSTCFATRQNSADD